MASALVIHPVFAAVRQGPGPGTRSEGSHPGFLGPPQCKESYEGMPLGGVRQGTIPARAIGGTT